MFRSVRFVFCFLMIVSAALWLPVQAQFSKATFLLTGSVTDAESNEPVHARLSFIDPNGAEANKVMTNSQGKYTAVLKPGLSYSVKVKASQKYVGTESVSFPASESSQQSSHNFTVKPIHTGTVFLNEVAFDHASVSPRSSAATAATAAGKAIALNDEIEVTVETFSDDGDGGTVPADQGTQRANALKQILLANGAPANRIVTNPHNPPPPPAPAAEEPAGKGKKKAKAVKKTKPAKKPVKGKKGAVVELPGSKASIIITKLHSEDD